jgi:diguanylate cyclase
MKLNVQPAVRASASRPLLAIVLALQAAHLFVLGFCAHPLVASNVLQLLIGVTAVSICRSQRQWISEAAGRRCWNAVAAAFLIWSTAQVLYLVYLAYPALRPTAFQPDDFLWTLFALPLLLAVNTFKEAVTDRVLWLDRIQGILFFAVLYLASFLPGVHFRTDVSFLIQNVALVLSCLLRLPNARSDREARFFLLLSLFLAVYAPMSMAGDFLHSHGWAPGSAVDLFWTVPNTVFCVLILWRPASPFQMTGRERVVSLIRQTQGLSAAVLALLTIAVSADIARHCPSTGAVCIAVAFGVFAMRTNVREIAWYTAHGQLQKTVLQDALTRLGNRLQLRNHLADRVADPDARVALIFADLDHFKSVNDTLGHALGDEFLMEIANRLCAAAPPDSVICRLGGDEFVVLTRAENLQAGQSIAEALLAALYPPVRIGAHELRCTASLGVVLVKSGDDPDDLLRTADHAMYRAKQLGKNRVQLFDATLLVQMKRQRQMESELRACIAANAIEVAFQPIYSVERGEICGFEALARWSNPHLGNVPPSEFVSLAEETGLILQLGAQILEKACLQMATWNRAWGTEFSVSVNVSPYQFSDLELIPSLMAMLERTGLPPNLLRLEITETALLLHESVVKHTLEQARLYGIRISLDDFGTGYSSLSFLLSLPVDEVKVDRSFVSHMHQDPHREELVRTVIHLGHSLGKRVIAEGVETERDLQGLTRMGCECVQGYLISRPLSVEVLEAELSNIRGRGKQIALANSNTPRALRRIGPEQVSERPELPEPLPVMMA